MERSAMRGRWSRIALALHPGYGPILAALLLFSFPALAQQRGAPSPPAKITISARAIDNFKAGENNDQVRFGALEFRGGLELTSSYREFGGVSAIRVAADGARFVALTDKGRWLTGRLTYTRERPSGIADAVMAPMLGQDGRTLASRGWFDPESIAEDGSALYVGIERVNRIVRFDFGRDGVLARAVPIPTPPGISR